MLGSNRIQEKNKGGNNCKLFFFKVISVLFMSGF